MLWCFADGRNKWLDQKLIKLLIKCYKNMWSIMLTSIASTCELLPVMCPGNDWALIGAAACIIKILSYCTHYHVLFNSSPNRKIELIRCVYIMYVQTSGNLCQLNTDPQSNWICVLLKGPSNSIREISLHNLPCVVNFQ